MKSIEFLQRDRSTIEVRSYMPISGEPGSTTETSFDVYSFIPVSFGAAPLTTSSKELGKQFQSLYRLQFPRVTLKELLNFESGQSPLKQLKDLIEALPSGLRDDEAIDLASLARFCGAELIEALFREHKQIEERLSQDDDPAIILRELEQLCEQTVRASQQLRIRKTKAESFQYI